MGARRSHPATNVLIRTKLTWTFLALTLGPLAAIGLFAEQRAERALRESLGASIARMASETIDNVDRVLSTVQERVGLWVGLGAMQEVVTGDLDGRISSFLLAVGKESPEFASIDVADARGEIVASSLPSLVGADLAGDPSVAAALRGESVVRDAERDERRRAWVVSFCAPIRGRFEVSEVIGALCARWDARELAGMTKGLLRAKNGATEVVALVMRGDGLALSPPPSTPEATLGTSLLERGLDPVPGGSEEGFAVQTLEGGEAYLVGYGQSRGHERFGGLGWSALVVQDLGRAFAPIHQLKFFTAGAGALLALGVIVLAVAISHRLADPVVRMAEVAKRVAAGDFEGRVGYRSSDEIGTLSTVFDGMTADLERQRGERRRAEEQLRASLADKEVLLKEVHHRVKNNLQVITSLLSLQSEHIRDPHALDIFKDSESRVRSMALIHETLYRSGNLSRLDVSDYLKTLVHDLVGFYGGGSSPVRLQTDIEAIELGLDTAIHCGLLVNELVSNALKHAFPGGRGGTVRIELKKGAGAQYRLVVADDGVGLDPDVEQSDTLGLQLIHTLADHLEGHVSQHREGGTTFEILFRDIDGPTAGGVPD